MRIVLASRIEIMNTFLTDNALHEFSEFFASAGSCVDTSINVAVNGKIPQPNTPCEA